MSSQGGSGPQAAAGPTKGGARATQQCKDNKCKSLKKCLEKAREYDKEKNLHNLLSEAKKEVSKLSAERLCLEDAIRMYLAAQLTQLPKDEKDKFFLWMRDDNKLTPREQNNYKEAVNTTRVRPAEEVDHKLQARYNDGILFLKDIACREYDIKVNSEHNLPDVIGKLILARMDVEKAKVCHKDACNEGVNEARDIWKKYREYRLAEFKKQKLIYEVQALHYALALMKIVYSEDKQTRELTQKPRNTGTELPNPIMLNKIYQRAVNLVRRLQWRGGLPSAEIGRAFHDAVESEGNMIEEPNQEQCRTLQEHRRRLTVHRGIMNVALKKNELNNLEQDSELSDFTKFASVKDQLDWVDEEVQILEEMMEEEQNGPSEEELEKWREEEKEIEKKFTESAEKLKKEFLQGYEQALLFVLQNADTIFRYVYPTDTNPGILYQVPDYVQRGIIDPIMCTHILSFLKRIYNLSEQYLDPTQQEGQQPIDETLALDQTPNLPPSTVSSAPNATRKRKDGSGGSTIPSKTRPNDDSSKPGSSSKK